MLDKYFLFLILSHEFYNFQMTIPIRHHTQMGLGWAIIKDNSQVHTQHIHKQLDFTSHGHCTALVISLPMFKSKFTQTHKTASKCSIKSLIATVTMKRTQY